MTSRTLTPEEERLASAVQRHKLALHALAENEFDKKGQDDGTLLRLEESLALYALANAARDLVRSWSKP